MDIEAHNLKIVLILTFGFGFASLFGYITQRAKLSPIVGYLFAGYLIGPFSPGFVADLEIAEQLAEIGVVLMMFGVGLHFKWQDLLKVKNIAIPGAIGQTAVAALSATFLLHYLGWSLQAGIIIGLSIGVASTVVLVRVLSDQNLLDTPEGHVSIGWLIVEDLLTVVVLLAIPLLATSHLSFLDLGSSLLLVLLKFLVLAVLMFTLGQKIVSYLLFKVARTRSQELFTITVLALTFVIATSSAYIFGTSIPLGAFIAGMVIGQTQVSHQASSQALPIQDAFFVIFFLSVGMLFNPAALLLHPALFFAILGIILIIKPLTAYLISVALHYPVKTALTVALALAQIGEFSFILSEEAMKYKLLPEEGFDLIVACAIAAISLNPLLFKGLEKTISFLGVHKTLSSVSSSPQALLVGYGPIGQRVAHTLKRMGITPVIIDLNVDTVTQLIGNKQQAIFGDASQAHILESAQIETATLLVITIPDANGALQIIATARQLKKDLKILARARFLSDRPPLAALGVEVICCEKEAMHAFEKALYKLKF